MIPEHDRSIRARRWRYPGVTGQFEEEFTMMGWYGGGMGALGWLAMGVFWVFLLGLIVWLVIRLLPGSSRMTSHTISPSKKTQNTPMASHPSAPIPPPYQPIIVNSSSNCPVTPGYLQRRARMLRSCSGIMKKRRRNPRQARLGADAQISAASRSRRGLEVMSQTGWRSTVPKD